MTQPSNLKVKRLLELDQLPPGAVEEAWMYAVRPGNPNKDHKVFLPDLIEEAVEVVSDEILQEAGEYTDQEVDQVRQDLLATVDGLGTDMVTYKLDDTDSVARGLRDKLGDIVSVKDFGAAGDGATEDTVAFRNAILELDRRGGGTLLVPAGTYVINDIVELRSNIHIVGDGATIIKTQASPYVVFAALSGTAQGYGSSVQNVSATGLTFRGDFANNIALCAFALHHAQNVTITNCTFTQAVRNGHVIDMNGCDGVTVRDCVFTGFNPSSSGYYRAEAIQMDVSAAGAVSALDDPASYDGLLTRNVVVENCKFLPETVGSTTYPCPNPVGAHSTIEGQQYEGLRFTNNLIIDPIEDVATDDTETGAVKGLIHFPGLKNAVIADNEFIMNENRCVRVISIYSMTVGIASTADFSQTGLSTGPITPVLSQNITIRDNVFRGFSHRSGIPDQQTIFLRGLATAPVENVVVTGNKFEDGYRNEQNHMYLLGRNCDGVTFSGNTVTDCGTAIKSEGGSRWQAVGNTFIRCRAQPILVQDTYGFAIMSNTARVCGRGFRSQNASRNVTITGNTFSESTDTGLQAAGIEVGGSTDNFTVTGNVVFYDGTETAGITIGSGVSNGVVVGNMATGYTTKVSIAGTPTNVTAANNY